MRRFTVLAVVVLAATLVMVARPADGATQQFTWFDQVVSHTYNTYAQPTQSTATPASWNSPVNYAGGRVYARIQVLEKPSTKPLDLQICAWRHGERRWQYETCTRVIQRFTSTGVLWIDFGVPNTWWYMNGVWTWGTRFDVVRLMVKDPNTGKLMQTDNCGAYCSTTSAVSGHIPLKFDAHAIVVASGATLAPPSDWGGCPGSWSPACSGTTVPTTSSTTSTTKPPTSSTTSSTTSTSTTSTTSTTVPSSGKDAALLVGSAATIPSKDAAIRNRLVALGYKVVLVDDDGLTTAKLTGAELVVVSSSVVPSKIPSWLATWDAPLLDLEAYIQKTLRLATSAQELGSKTTVRIVSASHPLAAGRSGDVVVQGSVAMAAATPVSSAAVVARVPGTTSASLYGIEDGAALTSGTAPDRRVALFFSYDSPPTLTTAGWSLFDAAVTWVVA